MASLFTYLTADNITGVAEALCGMIAGASRTTPFHMCGRLLTS
jgi:hypothetical protein